MRSPESPQSPPVPVDIPTPRKLQHISTTDAESNVGNASAAKGCSFINNQSTDSNLNDQHGRSPLFTAAVLGNTAQVKDLLERSADINVRDSIGNTPLTASIVCGDVSLIRYLLANGADCNIPNQHGVTPLFLACKQGNLEAVTLLLNHKANVNPSTLHAETPLHIASFSGYEKICELLLAHGAKVDAPDHYRHTPLHHAAINGHAAIVYQLTKGRDININAGDSEGRTALHAAALMGFDNIVRHLLLCSADLSVQDRHGNTPEYYAIREGRKDVYMTLSKARSVVNTQASARCGLKFGRSIFDSFPTKAFSPSTSSLAKTISGVISLVQ